MDELIWKSDAVREIMKHFGVTMVDAAWILSEIKGVACCEDCPNKDRAEDDCK